MLGSGSHAENQVDMNVMLHKNKGYIILIHYITLLSKCIFIKWMRGKNVIHRLNKQIAMSNVSIPIIQ